MTCGALVAFGQPWAFVPAAFILITLRKPITFCFFFLTLFAIPAFYQLPNQEFLNGTGYFIPKTVTAAKRGGWIYKGTLLSFIANGETTLSGKHLSCNAFSKTRVSLGNVYCVEGILKKKRGFFLKTKKAWRIEKVTHSLAERRFVWKETVRTYLTRVLPHERSSHFLAGLVTGELQDPMLFKEFGELGLSHLLAISGFHFSLLALFFHFFLKNLFPSKGCAALLVFVLSAYLIFLGSAPSVERAWTASTLFFLGHLFEKRTRPLNSLGVGLCLAMLLEPTLCQHLGFQLSFLATAALLMLTSPINSLLQTWIPKRFFNQLIHRSIIFQHAYIIRSLFRDAIALSLAVHGALLPLILFIFHQFNAHSFLYNLFFPFLVSLSLLFFLLTVPICWIIPSLGYAMHNLNSIYTYGILKITESPALLSRTWYVDNLSEAFVAFSLTGIFVAGILTQSWMERHRDTTSPLKFAWL